MNKIYYTGLFLFMGLSIYAQNKFWQKDISIIDANLRTTLAVVLDELEVNFPTNGYALVKFEGNVWSSKQDRIILAASDIANWSSNDGNVGVKAIDSIHSISTFAHSRFYNVQKGLKKFYAIGHNFVDREGNGRATIIGRLTVEFIPSQNTLQRVSSFGNVIFPKQKLIESPVARTALNLRPSS